MHRDAHASHAHVSEPAAAGPAERADWQVAPGTWNPTADSRNPWDTAGDTVTHPRFEACAALLRRYAPGGSVLEIGCGEALLMQHMQPEDYKNWLGVDISQMAIERAQRFRNDHAHYIAGDMSKLELAEKYDAIVFDAIIFSESVYYVPDPARLLSRYARHLNPGGVFLISIFAEKDQAPVWQEIYSVARPIDSRVTKNDHGTWICEVLQMKS